jgi:hypothetical protein
MIITVIIIMVKLLPFQHFELFEKPIIFCRKCENYPEKLGSGTETDMRNRNRYAPKI